MNIDTAKPFLSQLAKALSQQFGSQCEVAVHDLTKGYENTIILIENGHVTGRKIGDDASEIVLTSIKSGNHLEDTFNYLTKTVDGKMLKSSSIYIRDDDEKAVALLSINYDVTEITYASSILNQLAGTSKSEENEEVETIVSNVNDLLEQLIQESYNYLGKPVALMTKEDKVRAIKYLDKKGAFLIKKSGDKISKFYDISKYTLYNYMDDDSQL